MSKSKKQLLLELLELEDENLGNTEISNDKIDEKPQDDIPSQKDEETDKITAPKKRGPKKGQITQLTEKQKEALKKGQQIRDENNRKRLEEKRLKEEEEKKIQEEKIIKKAISLKKKQIKKQKILEELSDDDDEQVIKEKILSTFKKAGGKTKNDTLDKTESRQRNGDLEEKPIPKYIFNFI